MHCLKVKLFEIKYLNVIKWKCPGGGVLSIFSQKLLIIIIGIGKKEKELEGGGKLGTV